MTTATPSHDLSELTLADLEFDPVCKVHRWVRWFSLFNGPRKDCQNPARWLASFPCCGNTFEVCNVCRDNDCDWLCCNRRFDREFLTWMKI